MLHLIPFVKIVSIYLKTSIIIIKMYLFTAIGLLPGGRGIML